MGEKPMGFSTTIGDDMHKGVILLVKANDKDEARQEVHNFMDNYGEGKVWDWYVIGGRWSGQLTSAKLDQNKLDSLHKEFGEKYGWWTSALISNEMRKKQYDTLFMEYFPDFKGIIPNWRDQYQQYGFEDDILPLSQAMEAVNQWKQEPQDEFDKEMKKAEERWGHNSEKGYDRNMYAYCVKNAASLLAEDFCFDCNVFNTYSENYSIPEDTNGWFAVIIDMHN